MHITHSQNTCSITELCGIYGKTQEEFQAELHNLIADAKAKSRKCIYACMHEHTSQEFGKLLKAEGFVHIGRYHGNSEPWVDLWIYGLEVPKSVVAAAPKAAIKKLTLRNTLRRIRKPILK